jgi:23S rRNA (cytidine1920-2'-O)/16S rRNA (cytidine1409-2'-O)-methyltransferase
VPRRRLDAELVRRGLVSSWTEAQAAVHEGMVIVSGRPAGNPSTMVEPAEPVELLGAGRPFVSRGGEKLDAALQRFGVDPSGRDCLDAGASTGGFSDCLLQRGAARVVAVDVGYGQLAWSLRSDARVTVLDRTNVRDLTRDGLPFVPDLVVADLSFISLRLVIPNLAEVAVVGANFVLLVKPQFEAGSKDVGKRGVVQDPVVWARTVESVAEACTASGVAPRAVMASPRPGPAGNVEFPLHAVKDGEPRALDVAAAVEEGCRLQRGGA